MEHVSRSELEANADAWDAAVARDPRVDPFCCGSAWQLSYHDAFEPGRGLWLAHEGDDWVVLAERVEGPRASLLEPLEDMWGFASPLVGEGAPGLLARSLMSRPRSVLLRGLPMDRRRLAPMVETLAASFVLRALRPTTRLVASLAGGLEGWLARRSKRFARNLRAAHRRVEADGIRFRYVQAATPSELEGLYARVLDVEGRSWKAAEGNAADRPPMRDFYAGLWRRLCERGELRLLFAERGDEPVGYVHGAVRAGHFRGLQVSFDDVLRPLGVGNVLQLEMIRRLCDEGVRYYDLGAHSDYKSRWAEPGLTTFGLLLEPREGAL